MRKRFRQFRRNSLRWFLGVWVIGIWLIFAVLVAGMLTATFKLHRQNLQLQRENTQLLDNVMMEVEVLSLRRKASQQSPFAESDFTAADKWRDQLLKNLADEEKRPHILQIIRDYGDFKKNALTGQTKGQMLLANNLYSHLQKLRSINTRQLQETRVMGTRISNLSWWWGIGLLGVTALLLLWGSLELWIRIFSPIIALSRTARAIGSGHMNVRVPILRNDEMGTLSRTFNHMADIMTEREKERMRFVAMVAHDLKNPLVIIGGLAHLLNKRGKTVSEQEHKEWLGQIVANTRKLEQNIAELADAAQASTGKVTVNKEQVDLCKLTREIVDEYQQMHKSYHIVCTAEELPPIEGDHAKIERVLVNLLSNAIKFSSDDSTVEVSVHTKGKWVCLHVSDQGAGISFADQEKIFTPFTRLEHTRDMARGSGLGLISVKKIVNAHGGKIRLRSKLGKGTRVVVMLPKE